MFTQFCLDIVSKVFSDKYRLPNLQYVALLLASVYVWIFLSVLCSTCCPSALHPSPSIHSDLVQHCICLWSVFPGHPIPSGPLQSDSCLWGSYCSCVYARSCAALCFPQKNLYENSSSSLDSLKSSQLFFCFPVRSNGSSLVECFEALDV